MSLEPAPRYEEEESGPEDTAGNVFRDKQGNPIWFFLHKSIKSDWQRQNLTNDIQLNGGIVRPNDSDVDTVLVGPGCNRVKIQTAYIANINKPSKRKVWVEPMSFVSKCLREGAVKHRLPEPKGMGGALGERTRFTHKDDENLARYLAIRIPDLNSGGRRGDNVYKELFDAYSEDPEEYTWVKRHTWQSWRNRYNKNFTRFNDMIDDYVKLEKPERKQAYCLQRKSKEWQFLDESTEENEKQSGYPPKRRRVDFSQELPENHVKISPSLAGKDKERMVSEDASDMHREPSSPFYEDIPLSEPGPSNRTPITTYAHRSRKQPDVSPSYDSEPYASQVTLVGTNHQTQEPRSRKGTVSDLPSQQPMHNEVTWGEAGVEVRQDRSPLTQESDALVAPMSSAQIFVGSASTKTVSTLPQHRPMARKTVQRNKTPSESAVIVSSIPSYSSTRSTSRSVEAYIPSPRRQVGAAVGSLGNTPPLLDESVNEDLIGDTLEEEQSVEDLLVNDMSGRSQATQGESQIRMKDNLLARNAANEPTSLDSDDAQIDDRLRQSQVRARISLPLEEPDVSPDQMLRHFREASVNTFHSPREPSLRAVPFSKIRAGPRRQRRSAPVYSHDIFSGVSLTEQPRTPVTKPHSRLRRESVSSVESFPITGTRASAVKNTETEGKRTPYRPPAGTRAALLTE